MAALADWHTRRVLSFPSAGADRCCRALGKAGDLICCNGCSTCEGCINVTKLAVLVVVIAGVLKIVGAAMKWPTWAIVLLGTVSMATVLLRDTGKDHAKAVDKVDQF